MKKILLLIFTLMLTGCLRDGPLLINTSPATTSSYLDNNVPDLMEENNVAGLSVAIIQDSKTVIMKSYGYRNVDKNQKNDKDTIFRAASLGKPVFAYIVVHLAQNGKINLDKPLINYFNKRIVPKDIRSDKITARMILSHSSGLPNFGHDNSKLALDFEPGSNFMYSGHGYVYLQKIVENITQKTLNQLANEIVFTPLKMHNSSYIWRENYKNKISLDYDKGMNEYETHNQTSTGFSAWSLYTSIVDYTKFVNHIVNNFQTKNSTSTLLLEPNVHVTNEIEWGLGWGLQKTTPHMSFWHWGSKRGFRHFVVSYPKENISIIVMSNSKDAFKMVYEIMVKSIGGSYPSYRWF